MRIATVHRIVVLGLIAAILWAAWLYLNRRPEDLPWTPLRLEQPIGLFTGRKLAGLTQHRTTFVAPCERRA